MKRDIGGGYKGQIPQDLAKQSFKNRFSFCPTPSLKVITLQIWEKENLLTEEEALCAL